MAGPAHWPKKIVAEMTVSPLQELVQVLSAGIGKKEIFASKYPIRQIAAGNNRIFKNYRLPLHVVYRIIKNPSGKRRKNLRGIE
jgi:hypothetical protein